MSAKERAKTVVVTGDFTLDWNLARRRGPEALNRIWEAAVCSWLRWQRGGAGLLADLIGGIAGGFAAMPLTRFGSHKRRSALEARRI